LRPSEFARTLNRHYIHLSCKQSSLPLLPLVRVKVSDPVSSYIRPPFWQKFVTMLAASARVAGSNPNVDDNFLSPLLKCSESRGGYCSAISCEIQRKFLLILLLLLLTDGS